MANRQDSGSNSAHENQRPTSHNEDAIPEMTDSAVNDETRNRAEDDDEFEDTDDLDEADDADDDDEEGSF
jgi:hypothetical protein